MYKPVVSCFDSFIMGKQNGVPLTLMFIILLSFWLDQSR